MRPFGEWGAETAYLGRYNPAMIWAIFFLVAPLSAGRRRAASDLGCNRRDRGHNRVNREYRPQAATAGFGHSFGQLQDIVEPVTALRYRSMYLSPFERYWGGESCVSRAAKPLMA